MKGLFWNLRGLANSPTRLALKRLVLKYKPDFLLLAEPWMDFQKFLANWLHIPGFKLFALNDRQDLLPNLWSICKLNLSPSNLSTTNQKVSFTLIETILSLVYL
jgi:hypothetical protein